ncbi:MAG TPA: hypothetical protein PKV80_19855 [Leptospiraceae bacterium]|nr:hypothetical protein [Leptospiraceae bacterium]
MKISRIEGNLPKMKHFKIKAFIINLLILIGFNGCLTLSLPWHRSSVSPELLSDSGNTEILLVYVSAEDTPRLFSEKQRTGFVYSGPRTVKALDEYLSANVSKTGELEAKLRSLPLSQIEGRKTVNFSPTGTAEHSYIRSNTISVYNHYSSDFVLTAKFLNRKLADRIRKEESTENENRAGVDGSLKEFKESESLKKFKKEIAEGKIPSDIEVVVLPSALGLTLGQTAVNVGTVILYPFAFAADILTSPFQLAYFIIKGEKLMIAIPR